MRLGIVGAGAIARRHLTALAGHADAVVAAVCDANAEVADAMASATGATAYAEWDAMLEAERLDAVFVCTPPAVHLGPARAAFERGVPVYLEKPLARSLEDGEAIVAAWRSSGALCAVGYQWRSLDVLDRVHAELAGAAPGLLVSRSLGPTERGRAGEWFGDARASGGILFELGSHDIDLQRSVAGPVTAVQAASAAGLLATSAKGAPALDDAVAIVMRFAGGGLGVVALGWTEAQKPPVYTLDVMAGDVALRLDLDPEFRLHGRARGAEVDAAAADDPRRSSVARFLEAAAGGGQATVPCSPEDALGTLRVALAAERALATDTTIDVGGG
jgi:myo-inositol 2-dehydrogenase / D-chiro-inositol 1-dehydrogenase